MVTKDEALKMALEALKDFLNPLHTDLMLDINRVDQKTRLAITAIREALAQPEHSCVACEGNPVGNNNPCAVCGMAQPEQEQVAYTGNGTAGREADVKPTGFFFQMPPQRKPLTKTRVGNYLRRHVNGDVGMYRNGFKDGVRFAEAAHGIKGEA